MTEDEHFGEIGRAVCDLRRLKGEAEGLRAQLKEHQRLLDTASIDLETLVRVDEAHARAFISEATKSLHAAEGTGKTAYLCLRYRQLLHDISGLEATIARA